MNLRAKLLLFSFYAFAFASFNQAAFAQKSNDVKLYEYSQRILAEQRIFDAAKKITKLPANLGESIPTRTERLDLDSLNIGMEGRLWDLAFRQLKGGGIIFKVVSVPDESNVLLINSEQKRIWLEGYPTTNLVDGENVVILDYVKVVGTKTYRKVDGSESKVWLLNLLPKEESEKRIRIDIEKEKRTVDPMDKEVGYREWKQTDQKKTMGRFVEFKSGKVYVEDKNGLITPLKFATLIESDKILARKLQKTKTEDQTAAKPQPNQPDKSKIESKTIPENRRKWNSVTYRSIITYVDDRKWTCVDSVTGDFSSHMEFRGQTADYIELFNLHPEHRDLIRLYDDRMECKHDSGWVTIGAGHWLPVDDATKTTVPNRDLSAEILDVKIVPESNPSGKRMRVVKVTWKNTGTKPIRSLDGFFYIKDNTETLPAKFEYSIYACSDFEDGVAPGEAFVLTTGGFMLPEGCNATEAKVEISKVLDKSNFAK
jgi:hypothetical protein